MPFASGSCLVTKAVKKHGIRRRNGKQLKCSLEVDISALIDPVGK